MSRANRIHHLVECTQQGHRLEQSELEARRLAPTLGCREHLGAARGASAERWKDAWRRFGAPEEQGLEVWQLHVRP